MLLLFILAAVSQVHCDIQNVEWEPASNRVEDGTLKQVHVLFRHGHRVPMTRFPTDPNANSSLWDDGPGHLTALGKQQGYQLGKNLRARYGRLLPSERAWKKVYTTSSDFSRTLMTAAVVLAGLLPPNDADKWSEIDWQPAPIHTLPEYMDNVLVPMPPCPKYDAIMNGMVEILSEEQRKVYDYVANHSGMAMRTSTPITMMYTCLQIQREAGLVLPNWTNEVFAFMKNVTARYFLQSVATKALIRLRTGPLLGELLKYNEKRPVRLYSTHDTVLGALLGALGTNNTNRPPGFASAVAVEYREDSKGEIHAQLWWREGPNDVMEQLKWPNCGLSCPIEKLKEILDPLIPENWYQECSTVNMQAASVAEETADAVPKVFLGVVVLLILVSLIIYRNKYKYEILH